MRGDMLLSRHSEIRAQPSSELHSHESLTLRSFASVEWFMLRGPSPCRVPRQMFRFYHSPAWEAERQRKLMRKIGTHRIICNSAICVGGKFELPPIFWHMCIHLKITHIYLFVKPILWFAAKLELFPLISLYCTMFTYTHIIKTDLVIFWA